MTYNQTQISGRLVRDAEVRQAGSSQLVEFTIASNRSYPKRGTGGNTGIAPDWQESVTYMDCKVWRDNLHDRVGSLSKGTEVLVVARLDQENWETADGSKRSKIVATITDKAHDVIPIARWDSIANSGNSVTAAASGGGVSVQAPPAEAPW